MTVADANPVTEVTDVTRADRSDRAFLGHPKGLGYLAFAEGCERFSYYGMQALLVLYMTHQLLLPGHVENVAFFEPFRSVVEGVYTAAGAARRRAASSVTDWTLIALRKV